MPPQFKTTHVILIASLLWFCTSNLVAQTKFHYVPTVSFNFYQPGNWYCDFPATTPCTPSWLSGSSNFTIPTTDTIVIHDVCVLIDVTTITNNGVVEVVNGTLSMTELSFFHHNGTMSIDVDSMVDNGDGGTYNLNNGSLTTLDGSMSISNFGNLNINSGSILTVSTTGELSYY